ncbi:MAG: hypothetical protein P8M19_05655, partial [Crocinitomicaceae bacterium]|nr:hypothetical protein [Crocinitomicaceae bacterium]
ALSRRGSRVRVPSRPQAHMAVGLEKLSKYQIYWAFCFSTNFKGIKKGAKITPENDPDFFIGVESSKNKRLKINEYT